MFNVYHRNNDGTLAKFESTEDNHAEAILSVCELFTENNESYNMPILAVIDGNKGKINVK